MPRVVFWNTLAGGVFAATSFVLQVLASRWVDVGATKYWTGVMSLTLAMSQQMATLSLFGMGTYLVADQAERHGFGEYVAARVMSTMGMFLVGGVWVWWSGLTWDKAILFWLFLGLRASEGIGAVYGSRYQQKGRLDATSRIAFVKNVSALVAFVGVLWLSRNLVAAVGAMVLAHAALFPVLDGAIVGEFRGDRTAHPWRNGARILGQCLPLAVNGFLLMYINNGTKYAVDAVLDETAVARFSAVFMTTFGLAMVADFLMSPHIAMLSAAYLRGERDVFLRKLGRLVAVIVALGGVGLLAAWVCGVEVLAWLFQMELGDCREELCMAILGGAFLPLYHLALTILVIQGRSNWGLPGVVVAAGVVYFSSQVFVQRWGLEGGNLCYLCAVVLLVLLTGLAAIVGLRAARPLRGSNP